MKRKIDSSGRAILTPNETRFCALIAAFGGATNCAVLAGYSERSAKQIASKTLAKPLIRNTVEDIKQRLAATT